MHNGRLRECRAGILEVGGHIHAVEDSRATPQHGVGSELIGEAKAGSKIVSIHWRATVARAGKHSRPDDVANLSKLGKGSRGIPIYGNADSRISSEVAEREPVEALGVGSAPLIAQAEIDRQLRGDLPVILHIEGGVFRLV